MTTPLNKGTLFPEHLVGGLISLVKGESALAALCGSTPIPFNGTKEFTFNFDKEVDIVAESGQKSPGGITVEPVTVVPIKFEYSARVSDEFLYGSQEYKVNVLEEFSSGFAKKLGKGIDIASFHGLNPRTGTASGVVGTNNFDAKITQLISATASPDDDMESAIAVIEGNEGNISGAAFAPAFRSKMAALKDGMGRKLYPELAWGQKVGSINGLPVTANPTVSFGGIDSLAYVGDFANYFKWGYAKEIPMEVIPYGNPDNDPAGDLKSRNQVCIRCEAYAGWGILVSDYFAAIKKVEEPTP